MPVKFFLISKKANRDAKKLPLNIHEKLDHAFTKLKENPLSGEKLHGALKSYYKFRVGDYRIVYRFNSKESLIIVVKIEHRQGVYK